jgi:hypothetical protein
MSDANPYDGTAAQVLPVPVERLPLFYWRPGARLLYVGSRDGTTFDGDLAASEASTFRRPVHAGLLVQLHAKSGTAGVVCAWSESLRFPQGVAAARGTDGALVVCSGGRGDAGLLAELLPVVDAWVLLTDAEPGPLAPAILAGGRHIEVVLGLDGRAPPALAWRRAAAVHLTARRAAEAEALDGWCAAVRAAWPEPAVPLHDLHHPHSDCPCGERLVWRSGARSRLDALDPATAACRVCGRTVRAFVSG